MDNELINGSTVLRSLQEVMAPDAAALLDPVVRFARQTPACSGNILELHLNKPGSPVDFATRLNLSFDKGLMERPLPFVEEWLSPLLERDTPGFLYGIENPWMEYDAPFTNAPALFFDIERGRPFSPAVVHASLEQLLPAYGLPVGGKLLSFLERVRDANLQVVYYGLMFSRHSSSLRLTIHGIRSCQLSNTLRELGWKGNYTALQQVQDDWLHDEQRVVVAVDLGNSLEGRLGIELFDKDPKGFIDRLYQWRRMDSVQLSLLQRWEQELELPVALQAGLSRLHQRPVTRLYSRVNHFKFVIDNTDDIAVKGYLYYCF